MSPVPQSTVAALLAQPATAARLSVVTLKQPRGAMPTSDELNALVQAIAAAGDRQAFAALFKHFAPRVKAFLMRSGTAEGLAEELVQETMISVWRKAAMFNPAQAAVSTWIFTIARNLRVDHFRRQGQREVQGDGTEADDMPDTAPALEDQVRTGRREKGVREAMCKLSPEQAQIVRLSFYEEHPHSRIALELGIPLGTVKSRVRLAVNHLRRLLDGLEP
ncbi:sigma-70 family RNA polymerase sigma factor [Variovorax sp. RTB1]|uniref:sigma-70 family RNA polymerase sigma factor n=1 Tax=Variovorax sp. RTB1 TaxID=3048631 RepID=UPI002B2263B2|nr:sigma-70 family RNA polymerase sigma factor [Variovorax sp. RTB1]MEB0111364.1 sigma-70 family RNA polymerase sigma factor [Variovorax sp. RTB1]